MYILMNTSLVSFTCVFLYYIGPAGGSIGLLDVQLLSQGHQTAQSWSHFNLQLIRPKVHKNFVAQPVSDKINTDITKVKIHELNWGIRLHQFKLHNIPTSSFHERFIIKDKSFIIAFSSVTAFLLIHWCQWPLHTNFINLSFQANIGEKFKQYAWHLRKGTYFIQNCCCIFPQKV